MQVTDSLDLGSWKLNECGFRGDLAQLDKSVCRAQVIVMRVANPSIRSIYLWCVYVPRNVTHSQLEIELPFACTPGKLLLAMKCVSVAACIR